MPHHRGKSPFIALQHDFGCYNPRRSIRGCEMIYSGRFSGRGAVITGGASGLGLETASRIVAEGGKVSLWDLDPEDLAAAKAKTGAVHTVALDVSKADAVQAAAIEAQKALGRIDILVNSAGITGATHTVIGYPIESWLKVFDVNVNGLFYCCRTIAPLMVEAGYGRIVNISSVAGKEGNPNASSYSASKAAVLGFTKSLGKELATKGVVVNAVTPATFESPILDHVPQSHIDYMRSKIPMERFGTAAENAAAVCWLASEECSFTTASTLDTSGGRTTY
jgi:3-oxoacyl-[acyl-carrier protein] reductase